MKNMDKIMLDTNILIYATDSKSKFYDKARDLINSKDNLSFCISDKTLCEYYAVLSSVITNPEEALSYFKFYLLNYSFEKISSTKYTLFYLLDLLSDQKFKGKHIFDIFSVALMKENNIEIIYTKNVKDFMVFDDIQVIDPLQ